MVGTVRVHIFQFLAGALLFSTNQCGLLSVIGRIFLFELLTCLIFYSGLERYQFHVVLLERTSV